jgi:DNA-binding XRE family transcriptional regulator
MVKKDKTLGERIKELRLGREMTQVDATMFFRVSLATIIRLEAGKDCSDLVRAKIEKVLNQYEVAA